MASCRIRKAYLCCHCNQELSKTSYYQHKKIYFDTTTKEWRKERIRPSAAVVEEFTFDGGSDIDIEEGNLALPSQESNGKQSTFR